MTILAKPAIIEALNKGDVMISPFNPDSVKNSSYDVSLGHWYYREAQRNTVATQYNQSHPGWVTDSTLPGVLTGLAFSSLLNPYSENSVHSMWEGPFRAQPLDYELEGIPKGTPIIMIGPGQNLLCHTHEFIGTTDLTHTTMMKARSSMGRNQITVCKCAGLGDIGYANRFTMEFTNMSQYATTILVPGRRVAQVLFMKTTGLDSEEQAYYSGGKYQANSHKGMKFEELEAQWKPDDMLPKMWKDQEVTGV